MRTKTADSPETGDIMILDYFKANASAGVHKGVVNRAVNGLERGKIETMGELMRASPEEIAKIRNVGAKSLELILLLRDKYAVERDNAGYAPIQEERA